jgi:hypothetical protein
MHSDRHQVAGKAQKETIQSSPEQSRAVHHLTVMKTQQRRGVFAMAFLLFAASVIAQMPNPPGQVAKGEKPKHEAYYEQYPGVAYGLSVAASLKGPWFQVAGGTQHQNWDKFSLPPKVRHGSMMPITRKQYDALIAAFGKPSGYGQRSW